MTMREEITKVLVEGATPLFLVGLMAIPEGRHDAVRKIIDEVGGVLYRREQELAERQWAARSKA